MTVRPESEDASVCVGEPCIVRVTLINATDRGLDILIGSGYTRLYVYAAGQPRPSPPIPTLDSGQIDVSFGACRIAPGKARSFLMLLPGSWVPQQPGEYRIAADQLSFAPDSRTIVKVAEVDAELHVKARDPKRLEARCQEWYWAWRGGRDRPRIPGALAFHALLTIQDDGALPYLDQLFRQGAPYMACAFDAIRRIGSPRANAVVAALAGREDYVGTIARDLLKRRAEPAQEADAFPVD